MLTVSGDVEKCIASEELGRKAMNCAWKGTCSRAHGFSSLLQMRKSSLLLPCAVYG